MTRVLLLGAGGMLGTDLAARVPRTTDLLPLTRRDLDVTDEAAVARVMRNEEPDVVLNATAYTDVDGAEREPEKAMQVNGAAPGILGRTAKAGALIIHYSTDYIFNDRVRRPLTEDDPPDPLNQYGRSKLEGERALAASGARHLIIRTQWLFGLHGRSFPRTMWERAHKRQETRVVNDQFGRPTYTVDLALATWRLLALFTVQRVAGGRLSVVGKSKGNPDHRPPSTDHRLFHIANSGITTWYEMAKRIFHAAGADEYLEPCTSAEFPRPARRPAWSALDTTRYESLVGKPLAAWEDALDRFLKDLTPAPLPPGEG